MMNQVQEICVTPPRQQISDLDNLPLVDRSLVDYETYNKFIGQAMVKNRISLFATRGCPYKCAYCHKIWPKRHYVRSAGNLVEEVQLYYDMGIRRFSFIDDIFNLDKKNSMEFFESIIQRGLKLQLLFPAGLRGDILTRDYIDLMIEAGTVNFALALETGSPRIQRYIRKNLKLDKFRENIEYACHQYPHVILELQTMLGFPGETEDEALMTLDFIKSLKWLHFPYVNVLKIFPHTDMEKLAFENGISREAIIKSRDLSYDQLPFTLPFGKHFAIQYQADFLHNYFLNKERLMAVLPYQMKLLTEDEMAQKYDNYLSFQVKSMDHLLEYAGITREELGINHCVPEDTFHVPDLNEKIKRAFPAKTPAADALKIMLLDLSRSLSCGKEVLYDVVEPPLGLMYLLTYLNHRLGSKINGKILKSGIDFQSFRELESLIRQFEPDVIGIRTLSLFRNYFHETVEMIRRWKPRVPVIAGGPYASSDYESILLDPNVDLVVLGEGEITFHELIEKVVENSGKLPETDTLKAIAGLAFTARRQVDFKTIGPEPADRRQKLSGLMDDLENE